MWLYLTIFFVVVILYAATINNPQSKGMLMGVMAFLAIFVGITDMFGGYDRYIYGECFDRAADAIRSDSNLGDILLFRLYGKEFGYCLLNLLIGLFTANRYIFILIVTLLIYTCLYFSFKRHATNYAYAVILFLGLWFFFSFTYLRQVLGASIVWLSIRYVSERNLKRFLLVVFIAISFHSSAIVLLPLYFVPIRVFKKKTILVVMGVLLLFGLTGGPAAIFDAYGGVMEDRRIEENLEESGFRIAYFVEAIFFLYYILKNYDRLTETEEQTVMTNAALIFCGILLFFVKSENGGRIGWYYMIGIISTLTYIATWQQRVTKTAIILMVVSLFLYVRVYNAWQGYGLNNLYPYKTFFTNGYREGDYTWQHYEYDHNYDVDKFYR